MYIIVERQTKQSSYWRIANESYLQCLSPWLRQSIECAALALSLRTVDEQHSCTVGRGSEGGPDGHVLASLLILIVD